MTSLSRPTRLGFSGKQIPTDPDRDTLDQPDVFCFRSPQLPVGKKFFRSFARYYSDRSMEAVVAESRCESLSELAAIILSRTQLKRGQPELALEILQSFLEQHGESRGVSEEISRILSAISRS